MGKSDAGIMAYERVLNDDRVLIVINTQDEGEGISIGSTMDPNGTLMTVGFPAGSVLIDRLNGGNQSFVVDANQQVNIQLPPRSARILTL